MKFLVDRCAGRRLAEWLAGLGHDVIEARSFATDPGDEQLLKLAAEQKRVVITIDTDFGKLAFQNQAAHSGIIRLPDVPVRQRIDLLSDVLTQHATDVAQGAVITVRGARIRVTRSTMR